MIQVKDTEVLAALLMKEYDLNLIEIVIEVTQLTGKFCFTDGFRRGDKGVHGQDPCRGIDGRSWMYSKVELYAIEQHINSRWVYNPRKPDKKCCIVHDIGSGVHLHFQVHTNTRRST